MTKDDQEAIAQRASEKTLQQFFQVLGIDASDPIAMQRDFAFLRDLRTGTEKIKVKGILTFVAIATTAIVGALYTAFTNHR